MVAAATLWLTALASAQSDLDAPKITQFLDQTVAWYRGLALEQQIATDPSDLLVVADNRGVTDEVVRQAFVFARAAALLVQPAEQSEGSAAAGKYQSLYTLQTRLQQQIQSTQAELAGVKAKLDNAHGAARSALQSQLGELQGEIDLASARRDAVHSMIDFVSGNGSAGAGGNGLRARIEALASSVAPTSGAAARGAGEGSQGGAAAAPAASTPSPAVAAAPAAAETSSNSLWDMTSRVFSLAAKLRDVDALARQTAQLDAACKLLRTPLVALLQQYSQQGDQLASQADSADVAQLQQERAQLDALTNGFKQVSAALLPLAKQTVLLATLEGSWTSWHAAVQRQYRDALRGLGARLLILIAIIAAAVFGGELWRRAVYKYVHEARRRYQFLLLRRFVLWLVIVLIIVTAFASRLDSFVTFAGLITAGVAVALQNVILSVVGYFFLIGKYGIRVGDRVQIADVGGEVIDVGLVRMHLMEYGRDNAGPTGRVVAFSNSIVFQAAGGIFKQMPGVHFAWHETTLTLPAASDYRAVKQRLLEALKTALAEQQDELERQNREIERTAISGTTALQPSVRVRFVNGGAEFTARYPVDLRHVTDVDEAVSRELQAALGA